MGVFGFVMAFLVGAFFAVLGWGARNHQRHKFSRGIVTTGVVVGEKVRGISGDVYGFPVVEFKDAAGRVRSFVHPAGTNLTPKPGRHVPVWYDPEDPDEPPAIHGELVMSAMPYLFLGAGGLVLLGATAALYLAVIT